MNRLGKLLFTHAREVYLQKYTDFTVIDIHKAFGETFVKVVEVKESNGFLTLILENGERPGRCKDLAQQIRNERTIGGEGFGTQRIWSDGFEQPKAIGNVENALR